MSDYTNQHSDLMGGKTNTGGHKAGRTLLTKEECAAFLGIKQRTLEKYLGLRRIPCIRLSQKVVRFDMEEVMAALRKRS